MVIVINFIQNRRGKTNSNPDSGVYLVAHEMHTRQMSKAKAHPFKDNYNYKLLP